MDFLYLMLHPYLSEFNPEIMVGGAKQTKLDYRGA